MEKKKNKLFFIRIFILFVMIAGISSCDHRDDPLQIADTHNDAKFNTIEKRKNSELFVEAAEKLLQEIELSKLAQNNSIRSDVRITAKMFEEEYVKTLSNLKLIALQETITLPTEVSNKNNRKDKDASFEIGENFDKRYFEMSEKNHAETIKLVAFVEKQCSETKTNVWAKQTGVLLKKNLDNLLLLKAKVEKEKELNP